MNKKESKSELPSIEELENLSNNQIFFQIKTLEANYEALKIKMLRDYDKMTEMENLFHRAHQIVLGRIKKD